MARPRADLHDLSAALERLAADICRRVPGLGHIDPGRVLFTLARSRSQGRHGVQARIVPLRFAGGSPQEFRRRRGVRETWQCPRLEHDGRSILYLIQIMAPRFFRLSRREKLATVVHELFHISEACDGDLRRFPGRNYAHGRSRHAYQQQVEALLDQYLAAAPDPRLAAAIDIGEAAWRHGLTRVAGLTLPLPRARLVAREPL